jgi:hypothetical protein
MSDPAPTASGTIELAFGLFRTYAEFFISNRKKGDLALIVSTPKERRFALVSVEVAKEVLAQRKDVPPSEIKKIDQDPWAVSNSSDAFWLVADLGDLGWAFVAIAATPAPGGGVRTTVSSLN